MLGSDVVEKPGEDIPSHEVLQGWRNEAQQMTATAIKQAKTAVADAFYFKLQDAADMLQAFITKTDAEWIDEYEKFLKEFTKFMWDKSPTAPYYDSVENYDRTVAFMKRAGFDAAAALSTGSKAGDRNRQAIFALTLWYENRDRYWNWSDNPRQALEKALADMPEVSGIPNDEGCAIIDLRFELKRALRDVDTKKAAHEKAAAERLAALDTALLPVEEADYSGQYDEDDYGVGWDEEE